MAFRSDVSNNMQNSFTKKESPTKKLDTINLKEARIMVFEKIYPCSGLTVSTHNMILERLYRYLEPFAPGKRRRESLRITIPYIDILNCHIGKLNSGTVILLKLRENSYTSILKSFNKATFKDRSSPDYFLKIVTAKTIDSSEMRWLESNMRNLNVKVFILQGSGSFHSEQLLKGLVSAEELVSYVPEAIHLDDDDVFDDVIEEDIQRNELIKSNGNNVIFCDFLTLFPRAYLNDSILDYYLNHIQMDFEKRYPNLSISIVPAFRAEALIGKSYSKKHLPGTLEKFVRDKKIPACDYLVLPLVKDQHWFLAIITNLNCAFKYDYSDSSHSLYPSCDMPKVYYFDSFENYFGPKHRTEFNDKIFAFIRDCLIVYKTTTQYDDGDNDYNGTIKNLTTVSQPRTNSEKKGNVSVAKFSKNLFSFTYPPLPQQTNNHDCGLFLLEFAQRFFQDPIDITDRLQYNPNSLEKWFLPRQRIVTRTFLMDKIRNEISPETKQLLDYFVDNHKRRAFK